MMVRHRNSLHDELCAMCPSSLLLSKQCFLSSAMLYQLCFLCDLGAPSCKIMPPACNGCACHVLAICLQCACVVIHHDLCLEVRLACRQNRKLAWEDAWKHRRIKLSVEWLSHRSVHDLCLLSEPDFFLPVNICQMQVGKWQRGLVGCWGGGVGGPCAHVWLQGCTA